MGRESGLTATASRHERDVLVFVGRKRDVYFTSRTYCAQPAPPRSSRSTTHMCTRLGSFGARHRFVLELTRSPGALPVRSLSNAPAVANHATSIPSRWTTRLRVFKSRLTYVSAPAHPWMLVQSAGQLCIVSSRPQ